MIDMNDFTEENKAALDAADKFARRARRGLPSDRWTDGTNGASLVAEGIAAYQNLNADLLSVVRLIWADIQERDQRTKEGMGVYDTAGKRGDI